MSSSAAPPAAPPVPAAPLVPPPPPPVPPAAAEPEAPTPPATPVSGGSVPSVPLVTLPPAVPITKPMPWWVLALFGGALLISLDGLAAAVFITNDAALKPIVVMAIVNLAAGVMGYFFGSSMGSAKKDDNAAVQHAATINALANSAPVAPPAVPPPPTPAEAALDAHLAS